MVPPCDIIDKTSVEILQDLLSDISNDNDTINIFNLRKRGVAPNKSTEWSSLLLMYRANLQAAMEDASPGSHLQRCKIEKYLWIIIPIVLLLLGSIGNLASFAVLSRRRLPSYVYLSALAIADEGVLMTGLLRHFLDRLLGYRLEDSHQWVCSLTQMTGSSLSYLSAWLIVAVTAERAIVIAFPLSSIRYYSRTREVTVVCCITLTCIIVASHFIFSVRLETGQDKRFTLSETPMRNFSQCQMRQEFNTFSRVWHWFDGLLYSYLPFILIFALNVAIVSNVSRAKVNRNLMTARNPPIINPPHTNNNNNNMYSRYTNSITAASRQTLQITLMLVSISVCFLVTTCPIVAMKIVSLTLDRDKLRLSTLALYQMLDTIAELLMYLNHSANFYLYCATGAKFRSELRSLCTNGQSRARMITNRQYTQGKSRTQL